MTNTITNNSTGQEVAVIGMSIRFPGAKNISQYWENLISGTESLSFFSEEELKNLDADLQLLNHPKYVPARGGVLADDKKFFDADFFGYTPKEADLLDPQMRLFHECAYNALEDAGYASDSHGKYIGLYAGAGSGSYWESYQMISGNTEGFGPFASNFLTNKDFISTQSAYRLNLKGPCITVQTACSTSLVAIHMACQGILNGECDMALAGGVKIFPQEKVGYIYQDGMVSSPDGRCRPFDAKAKGIVDGEGAGIVVLKALDDAVKEGDHIYAVVKGTAINNDGTRKIGYTAPSVNGQAEVIRMAQQVAEVEPESIGYVEAHGTATELGDPVEVEALTLAFNTGKRNYCGIGSVKSNFGHLDAAAGVAGFVKAALSLKHKQIPPTLNYESPNPRIDFANSPFYVNHRLTEWERNGYPRRAGVSAFGIGGTNAHAILEEWRDNRPQDARENRRDHQLLLLSAKTQNSLDNISQNLLQYLKDNPGANLQDISYTLMVGRKNLEFKRMLVCKDIGEAVELLSNPGSRKVHTFYTKKQEKQVIFMFPGLGAQYADMGKDLYLKEKVFREAMDRCFAIIKSVAEIDLKPILYPATEKSAQPDKFNDFEIAQLTVFCFEYAMSQYLIKLGIKPDAMIGYSFGEYTAACISGVFSLEDTFKLIVARGQIINRAEQGEMLNVPMPVDEVTPLLDHRLSLAIDNGPSCIVAGKPEDVTAFSEQMKERKIICLKLEANRAIHSKMMEAVSDELATKIEGLKRNNPEIPYVSNVTGDWIKAEDAADPSYWAKHVKHTVRFDSGVKKLAETENAVFIEVGPGRDLSVLLKRYLQTQKEQYTLDLCRDSARDTEDMPFLLNRLGRLWLYGVDIDWSLYHGSNNGKRLPLPTYPFEPKHSLSKTDIFKDGLKKISKNPYFEKNPNMDEWFFIPVWEQSPTLAQYSGKNKEHRNWLIFMDSSGHGKHIKDRLTSENQTVTIVVPGNEYAEVNDQYIIINPENPEDYMKMFGKLMELTITPDQIIHLWNLSIKGTVESDFNEIDRALDLSLYSLMYTVRAIGANRISKKIKFMTVARDLHEITKEEQMNPLQAPTLGPVKIIPLEYPNISTRCIDIDASLADNVEDGKLTESLLAEFAEPSPDMVVAYRWNQRWTQHVKSCPLDEQKTSIPRIKEKGVYLITGGFGGMGFSITKDLATRLQARLILVGRSAFPERDLWDTWIAERGPEERISVRIQKIRELEEAGAQIRVASADISDEEEMRKVVAQAEKSFGKIDGVIHTAGIADYEGVIQRRTRKMNEIVMSPKVKGTMVLDRIFRDKNPEFIAYFSSLGNYLNKVKFGQVGYNAANEFIDAFVYNRCKENSSTHHVAINWTDWKEVGMTVYSMQRHLDKQGRSADPNSMLDHVLSPEEGVRVFLRIMGSRLNHVVLATQDLVQLMNLLKETEFEELEKVTPAGMQERPMLSVEYVEPGTEIEKQIVKIWEEFFGFQEIGIHDDFFELGGDSLKAILVVSLVEKIGYKVTLNDVLSNPTVHGLSSVIQGQATQRETDDEDAPEAALLAKCSCIEKLNKGQNDRNIFIVHPMHGLVNQYKELAVLLQDHYNVYGIQAKGMIPGANIHRHPKEMVDEYIENILTIQNNGPFLISGYCGGNTIAYEIVRRLEQMNHDVEKLIMIDASAFFSEKYLKIIKSLEILPNFVKKMFINHNEKKFQKASAAQKMAESHDISERIMLSKEEIGKNVYFLTRYIMPLELVKVPVFVPKARENKNPRAVPEHLRKMTKGKLTFEEIPGTHDNMVEKPYVDRLAEVILEDLR